MKKFKRNELGLFLDQFALKNETAAKLIEVSPKSFGTMINEMVAYAPKSILYKKMIFCKNYRLLLNQHLDMIAEVERNLLK